MMDMALGKRVVASGVALWLVAFLATGIFTALRLPATALPAAIVLLLVVAYATWAATSRLRMVSVSQALGAGAVWVVVNLLLDAVVVAWIGEGSGAHFRLWVVWARYLVLLLVPMLAASRKRTVS